MKTLSTLFFLLLGFSLSSAWAQPCFPTGYSPSSQEEIDNFATLYPDCTELLGNLTIGNNTSASPQIKNLDGFAQITRVHGRVSIQGMDSLKTLDGLQNITYIGEDFRILSCSDLESLNGLESLDSILGDFQIMNCSIDEINGIGSLSLVDRDLFIEDCTINAISGMNNLVSIGGNLQIIDSDISNISGWQNLQIIEGALVLEGLPNTIPPTDQFNTFNQLTSIGSGIFFEQVHGITDFSNFSKLTTVNGQLNLFDCHNLKSLEGLENLSAVNGTILISSCPYLENLKGLENIVNINGNLVLSNCTFLENLHGLESLVNVEGFMALNNCDHLTSISGLQNLVSINGRLSITFCGDLVSLTGLENLESINGDLELKSNSNLVSILSLEKLSPFGITNLSLSSNFSLGDCASPSICSYLMVYDDYNISNNDPGCDTFSEIIDACSGLLSKVQYFIFYDLNQNQVRDFNEPIFTDAGLQVNANILYDFGNSESGGTIILEPGNYTLTSNAGPQWDVTTSPEEIQIELTEANSCDSVYFGLFPNLEESFILTAIQSPPTRCNELITFEVSAKNIGTTIEGGTLWLEADPNIQAVDFIQTPDTIVEPNLFGWYFNNLYPSQSISRKISLQIPGPPDFPLGEPLNFFSYIDFMNQSWVQNATGFRYNPLVLCSYDPNDKLVNPSRDGNYTLFDEFLIYTVRFQNTGNDYARDVVIRDTLDANLDASTFQILSSSHENQLSTTLADGQFLTFDFSNIFLPDSTTDFEGSQGYVSYLIKGKEGLAENTPIENTASIYFDFNPPIVTNTTQNVMVSEIPTTSVNTLSPEHFNIFPNPTTDWVQVQYQGTGKVDFQLRNTVGQTLSSGRFSAQTSFSMKQLPTGVYWLQLKTELGSISQKVIHVSH